MPLRHNSASLHHGILVITAPLWKEGTTAASFCPSVVCLNQRACARARASCTLHHVWEELQVILDMSCAFEVFSCVHYSVNKKISLLTFVLTCQTCHRLPEVQGWLFTIPRTSILFLFRLYPLQNVSPANRASAATLIIRFCSGATVNSANISRLDLALVWCPGSKWQPICTYGDGCSDAIEIERAWSQI